MDRVQGSAWDHLIGVMGEDQPAHLLELARRFTSNYPENCAGWNVLANVLWDFALYDDARAALVESLRLTSPKGRPFAFLQCGLFREASGDYVRAARWYRRASRGTGNQRYLILLGGALAKQGRLDEAEDCHRAAIDAPDDPTDEAYLNIAFILRARGRYMEALDALDSALLIDPSYEQARKARTDIVLALKASRSVRAL